MALEAGTRLGVFEILAPLGKGGMGEVYRARDTKLSREVAIKVLPETLKDDTPRLARFQREATLLAALNHPHIASIYGLEEADGKPFLVLELAPGEDLSERIKRGPIPIDEALEIARQIAEALEAAHEKGIVHRDLKPANVKVTPEGQVMVLDFGLAKAYTDDASTEQDGDVSQSPTMSAQSTRAGAILGTSAYMSPEQARGKALDKRADIWAFGIVLFEMCTGRRLFTGETASEVLASVIKDEPDWTSLPAACPAALGRLLRRCLEKPPERRLRDIGDARLEIEDALAGPADTATAATPAGSSQWLPWSLAAVFGVAAIAAWFSSGSDPTPTARAAHVQVSLPVGVELAVDTEHPVLALSPDGSQLAFVGEESGIRRLYVRDLAEPDARALPGTNGAASPFFSPNGDWIAFLTDEHLLKKAPIGGGVPVAVHAAYGPAISRGATWSTDDTAIFAGSVNSGLARGSMSGEEILSFGEREAITDESAPFAWPHAIPGGDVVFTDHREGFLDDASIALLEVKTGKIEMLVRGGTNPRYSPTGHIIFARSGSLYAAAFDPERGEVLGREQRLVEGVMMEQNGAAQFTVAADGTIAYVAGGSAPREHALVWVDRHGRSDKLMDGRQFRDVRLSPDGGRLLLTSATGANWDIWLLDIERETLTRLTSHPGEDLHAVWSPDGARLALASEIAGSGPALAWMRSLNATPELLFMSPGSGIEIPSSWSPDGRWLAYLSGRGRQQDVWLMPMGEGGEPTPFLETPEYEAAPMFSPDGKWIAYVSDASGRDEVCVRTFPDPTEDVIQLSTRGGFEPVWARDGRELFYREGDKLMVVDLGEGPELEPRVPKMLFEGRFRKTRWGAQTANYDVSPDGSRFVMVQNRDRERPTVIHLVLNWPAAFPAHTPLER